MLKVFEQPNSVRDALRGRLSMEEATAKLGGGNDQCRTSPGRTDRFERMWHCLPCGHGWRVSPRISCPYSGRMRIRQRIALSQPPDDSRHTRLRHQSERRDRGHPGSLRESQRKGHRTLGICNNVASTIARESDGGVHACRTRDWRRGDKIVHLPAHHRHALALLLGRIHYLSYAEGLDIISQIEKLPDKVAKTLELNDQMAAIARKYSRALNFLSGTSGKLPIALEGALKLKEVSYCRFGYPSAELKHGVIALVNEETPSLFIAPRDAVFEKNLSNIEEVKARKGPVIALGTEGDQSLAKIADDVVSFRKLPITSPDSRSFPAIVGTTHRRRARLRRGQASNLLAKSVTVE